MPTAGLSPVHEFSVALRVRWAGAPPTAPPGSYGTILTKGPRHRATYALSIDDAGKLRFSAYRRVFDKRWGWFFGWIDNLAADQRYNQRTEVEVTEPLPLNEWQHVVVTFGRDYMRIYVEGVEGWLLLNKPGKLPNVAS